MRKYRPRAGQRAKFRLILWVHWDPFNRHFNDESNTVFSRYVLQIRIETQISLVKYWLTRKILKYLKIRLEPVSITKRIIPPVIIAISTKSLSKISSRTLAYNSLKNSKAEFDFSLFSTKVLFADSVGPWRWSETCSSPKTSLSEELSKGSGFCSKILFSFTRQRN